MRPLRQVSFLIVSSLILIGIVVSCNKSDRDEDIETLAARDYALAHHIFDDAFREVHRFAMRDSLLNDTGLIIWFDDCIYRALLDDTVAVFPLNLTLNYSDQGIQCNDGFFRYGIINAEFTGKYLNKGTTVTITFEGYRKDIYDVSGTIHITNLGLNADAKRQYRMTIEEGLITGPNIEIEMAGEFVMVWSDGSSTDSAIDDDVFLISGLCWGENSRGSTFTNEITTRYTNKLGCQWFVSGRSEMNIQNLNTRYLNFGDIDSCDNRLLSRRNNTYFKIDIPY